MTTFAWAALLGLTLGSARERGTLIVTNMNDNTATVIDLASRTVRATLPTGIGPHEVAASHNGRWAVVTNYGIRGKPGNSLTVLDLTTATVARTIDLGEYQRPHGIAFFPGDSLLVLTSEASRTVLVVEFATGRVVGAVATERPTSHMLALAASGELLYTTNIGDGSITAINLRARTTGAVTPVARLVEGLTITPDGTQVWVGSNGDSIVVVVDTRSGRAVDTLRGFGMPYRLGITPDGRTAVITDPAKAEVRIVNVATRKERFRISIPPDSVLSTAEFPGSASPEGVTAATRDVAYITLQGRNQAAGIDLATGKILWHLPVGAWPDGIAYAPAR